MCIRDRTLISVSAVKDYVPYSWLSLVQVKREHYSALAHYHSAIGLLSHDLESLSDQTRQVLQYLHVDSDSKTQLDIKEPHDNHERKTLGKWVVKFITNSCTNIFKKVYETFVNLNKRRQVCFREINMSDIHT